MGSPNKTLDVILRGTSDANIAFEDLRQVLLRLGFVERTKGSHHLFRRAGVPLLVNLHRDSSKAKPYQVRQVRQILLRYKLAEEIHG